MSSTTLSLIVPDLIDPVPYLKELPSQDLPELPVFSSFLSRGKLINSDICDHSNNNFYNCLLNHFSLQTHFPQLPIASLSYYFDIKSFDTKSFDTKSIVESDTDNFPPLEELKDKWLMRLDPCFMVADRDQLVLAKTGNLDISLQEAEQLVEEVNQFFSQFDDDSFWTIKVISPERWYLISDKPISIEMVPPERALGQALKSYLFSGDTEENRYWLNLFNEFQMILHQSNINKQRRENNKVPINSVWFWGQDNNIDLVNSLAVKENTMGNIVVYTDNIIAQGLALVNGGTYSQVPDNYLSASNDIGQHITYVIDDFSRAIQNKDIFNWVGLLQQFEKNYLIPILSDLNSGRISQLELVSPTGKKLLVTKKLIRRWWRKNKKFHLFF